MLQGFSRANLIVMPAWFDYYRTLTAHGVLMALVFTTFFITGSMTYASQPPNSGTQSIAKSASAPSK